MPYRLAEVVPKRLFRGGVPSKAEVVMLRDKYGINKIVSLDDECGQRIQPVCRDLGINQILWGVGDGHDPKIAAIKSRIVPALLHDGPTYVHCKHGKDRTGMTIAMFRVYTGWPLSHALAEAFKFGMGKGLSKEVRDSYYDAVRDFYKSRNEDSSSAMDAVTMTRSTNTFGPGNPGVNDMTFPRTMEHTFNPPHADIEFSNLSRTASGRVFCKCNPSNVLKPKMFWWTSADEAKNNPADSNGRLFSAKFGVDAEVERFDKPVNQALIHHILTKEIDIAALKGGMYLILYPGALVDIQEEGDINDMFMPDVGTRDNSTDYTFAYPGSGAGVGGMPDGAAGAVQLPYSGQGQV